MVSYAYRLRCGGALPTATAGHHQHRQQPPDPPAHRQRDPQDLTDHTRSKSPPSPWRCSLWPTVTLACAQLCPDGTQNCWPAMQDGRRRWSRSKAARQRPDVVRTVSSRMRLRNDMVNFNVLPDQVLPVTPALPPAHHINDRSLPPWWS